MGLPASGKSTWAKGIVAKDSSYVRVNRDDLRSMIHNDVWNGKREKTTVAARDALIAAFLAAGKNVIVDDTNLSPKVMDELKAIARANGANFEIKDFTDVSVDTCIERDSKRSASVGKSVIMKMWRQYLKPAPVEQPEGAQKVIICDMDGTLSLLGGRDPYDESTCANDPPNVPVVAMVNGYLASNPDVGLIVFSGRDEGRGRTGTEIWLENNIDRKPIVLGMRPAGSQAKDSIIKMDLFNEHVRDKYFVEFVVDDRLSVVELWRDHLGLPTFQVEWGDF